MIAYLDRDDVLAVAARVLDGDPGVRDIGLLDAAIARPRSTVFGLDTYRTVFDKAAALLHSLARNDALVDGNKRTAWASTWLFLGYNGVSLAGDFDVDAAEAFMNDVAMGQDDMSRIAATLLEFSERQR